MSIFSEKSLYYQREEVLGRQSVLGPGPELGKGGGVVFVETR